MIAIINNKNKNTENVLNKVSSLLKKQKKNYRVINSYPFNEEDKQIITDAELIIITGGDGTILSTLSQINNLKNIPIIPIHFGTLGFICSVTSEKAENLINSYLENIKNSFKIEKRSILKCEYNNNTYYALNDAVIAKGDKWKLLHMRASFNQTPTLTFRADGIIISTATGSTAYNLSANGPILHPSIDAVIFNPICPHSLTIKPIVLPGNDKIDITIKNSNPENEPSLIVDGSKRCPLSIDTTVSFTLSEKKISLIKPIEEHYYTTLKTKLHWGMGET